MGTLSATRFLSKVAWPSSRAWAARSSPPVSLGVDRAQAAAIAEEIRRAFEQTLVRAGNATLSATVSIGVAFVDGGQEASELLSTADRALYAAKASGRNAVWIAGKDGAPRFASGPAAQPNERAPSPGRTERTPMANCA
ncbi:GGDEF domain-containing protein [Ensifer canadensis]